MQITDREVGVGRDADRTTVLRSCRVQLRGFVQRYRNDLESVSYGVVSSDLPCPTSCYYGLVAVRA